MTITMMPSVEKNLMIFTQAPKESSINTDTCHWAWEGTEGHTYRAEIRAFNHQQGFSLLLGLLPDPRPQDTYSHAVLAPTGHAIGTLRSPRGW